MGEPLKRLILPLTEQKTAAFFVYVALGADRGCKSRPLVGREKNPVIYVSCPDFFFSIYCDFSAPGEVWDPFAQ